MVTALLRLIDDFLPELEGLHEDILRWSQGLRGYVGTNPRDLLTISASLRQYLAPITSALVGFLPKLVHVHLDVEIITCMGTATP